MKRLWVGFASVLILSFAVLGWIGTRVYQQAPPVPLRVVTTDGQVLERIDTREDVRLYAPEDLALLLRESRFAIERHWWDYNVGDRRAAAQYFTISARKAN